MEIKDKEAKIEELKAIVDEIKHITEEREEITEQVLEFLEKGEPFNFGTPTENYDVTLTIKLKEKVKEE